MGKVIAGIVAVIIILGGVGLVMANKDKKDATDSTATTSQTSMNDSMNMSTESNDTKATTTPSTNSTATSGSDVEIKNTDYTQKKITVKVGTKVTWTNKDSVKHDVMPAKDYGDTFKASELLGKDQTYSFTFTKAGTYDYYCTPHPFMKATVVVTE